MQMAGLVSDRLGLLGYLRPGGAWTTHSGFCRSAPRSPDSSPSVASSRAIATFTSLRIPQGEQRPARAFFFRALLVF